MNRKKTSPKVQAPKPPLVTQPVKIRVLLVDDHPTMREGLIRVIEREADMMVCGEAESIQRALEDRSAVRRDRGRLYRFGNRCGTGPEL
jgi:PleD family two-component response regulator